MDQSLSEICKSVNEIYIYIFFLRLEMQYALDNFDVRPSSVENEATLKCSFNLLKTCVKDHGDNFSQLLERMISLVCIEALLLAVL